MEQKTVRKDINITVRPGITSDVPALIGLHRTVSEEPGALIRRKEEITTAYLKDVMQKCRKKGLMLVAMMDGVLIGEIHAYTPDLFAFSHLLSELTIVVHPEHQGKGVGRKLFVQFLEQVQKEFPHILRVELYTREHNQKNVDFYTSLGFQNEGRQANKIRLEDNGFHSPIHMVWFNPNYQSK